MESLHDPKGIVKTKYPNQGDYLEEKKEIEFNIGQCYEEEPAKTLVCKHCGSDQFKVAQGSHFTAVKCIKCEYEVCIHDG